MHVYAFGFYVWCGCCQDDEDEEHDLRGVVVADNKLFVCDFGNSCIRVYCLGGRHINTWKPIFDGKVATPR
jgi:hypothetical protein